MNIQEYTRDNFLISTDPKKVDIDAVHEFLSRSYWAEGIPKEIVARAIQHSLCFGVYENKRQIGFARVISDYSSFGYLADVYVLEFYRGRGLAKWLMSCIMAHPELQNFRRWSLITRDAHSLYKQFGFAPLKNPDRYMELHVPDIYKKSV
jgi:GNAT superfamily N-acetyltransferase